MTICALLLRHRFYSLKPSESLKYATLGLLFVNISVGGVLTQFAFPSGCDRRERLALGPGVHANPFRLESCHRSRNDRPAGPLHRNCQRSFVEAK